MERKIHFENWCHWIIFVESLTDQPFSSSILWWTREYTRIYDTIAVSIFNHEIVTAKLLSLERIWHVGLDCGVVERCYQRFICVIRFGHACVEIWVAARIIYGTMELMFHTSEQKYIYLFFHLENSHKRLIYHHVKVVKGNRTYTHTHSPP